MDVIENGINVLKKFNFLVQHIIYLYQCLSEIKFEYNGNIINEGDNYIINKSDKGKNIFNDLSYISMTKIQYMQFNEDKFGLK